MVTVLLTKSVDPAATGTLRMPVSLGNNAKNSQTYRPVSMPSGAGLHGVANED